MHSDQMPAVESPPVSYGHVWSDPAHKLAQIYQSCESPGAALCAALSLGYFSQYTCYTGKTLVARITDWEIELLSQRFGDFLKLFPSDFEEKASVPEATLVKWNGRSVTPDLLRNVWYALQIRSLVGGRLELSKSRVLEIGSGSGSFARVYKAVNPEAQIWLADLPESLRFAEIYLRESFPNARTLFAKDPGDLKGDIATFDFIFVPLHLKEALVGLPFDLALNIWSFGEMPNHFIQDWFDLVQSGCQVRFFFTMNAFLAPVTMDSVERANQGDWMLRFDKCWNVLHFQVNPEIHRNPFIRNFYSGLCVFAERIRSDTEYQAQVSAAQTGLSSVMMEDWVGVLLRENSNLARPETEFAGAAETLPVEPRYFLPQLMATTEYVGRFNINEGTSGALFRLWNAFRVTELSLAGELLTCYIAMVAKTLLSCRCSKEELQILRRLPNSSLRDDYKGFISQMEDLAADFIQQACDKAIVAFQNGQFEEASDAFGKICHRLPRHGDAWHFQSLCQEKLGRCALSAVCAKIAVVLAPGVTHYEGNLTRMTGAARKTHWRVFLLDSLVHRLGPSFYAGLIATRIDGLLTSLRSPDALVVCAAAFIRESSIPTSLALRMVKILGQSRQPQLAAAFQAFVDGQP